MKMRPATNSRRRYQKTRALADTILNIVNVTFADLSLSTRQVFYQVVSRGAVKNCQSGYDRVQRLLVDMRLEGLVSFDRIVDRTRSKHHRRGWGGVRDLMSSAARQYRRNRWADQQTQVMICCEKQALEGIFAEVVDEYGASLWTIRGFNSWSFACEWANEIEELTAEGKTVVVAYFGDHDPSGLALERDCQSKLGHFIADVEWRRCGLLFEDLDEFHMVNVPVKHSDSRARGYLAKFGDRAAELDALPPNELRGRIRSALEEHIDVETWNRLVLQERVEKESLDLVVNNWETAVRAAGGAA